MIRYVELMRSNPKDFVEAPGQKLDRAPVTAPYSDANRRASMPQPTGDQPTNRPGDGRGVYRPPSGAGGPGSGASAAASQPAENQGRDGASATSQASVLAPSSESRASGGVDWRSAIREVGKVATLGGGGGLDLGVEPGGGEKGFAEPGTLSFETQWYDWGPYAQSMVSKIRVNWYQNMPPLLRTGMQGVVTIRFTIQRSGRITDITLLKSSEIPPYDFAARKAIELSSPLNPLPADFPNAYERVTCMFYYNLEPPSR